MILPSKLVNTKVLLAAVIVFIGLVVLGIVDTGIRHVDVVVNNIILVEQNDSLKYQVAKLQHTVDTTSTQTIDSLVEVSTARDLLVQTMTDQLDSTKQQLEHEKRNSIISPYNTIPYRMEPVELPGTEDY